MSLADKDGGIEPCDYVVAHGIQSRLDQLKKTAADNENYILHEYFHTSWTLFYFTQIAEEAAQGKLRFLGTATLPENYDALLPEPMRKVLNTAPDQVDLKFKTGFGEVTGKQEVYKPIIDQIAKGPVKIADLNKSLIKDGQALAQGDATIRELETRLGVFVEKTLPMIQRLGGVK